MSSEAFDGVARGHYGLIMVDLPWNFRTFSQKGLDGRPQHYNRMTLPDIKALPVADLAAKDCFLFLWVTSPHLKNAFAVADAWGFQYSARAFVWIKLLKSMGKSPKLFYDTVNDLHTGQGYTTRKNAEDCLLFKRGKPKRIHKGIREPIITPVREHSRKPDEAYSRARQFAAGPYLELFARQTRLGWDAWGNETGKFDGAAT